MVYFTDIRKTKHYEENHEMQVPLFEITKVIFASQKLMRKKQENIEIETNNYYILFKVEKGIAYILNAKRK